MRPSRLLPVIFVSGWAMACATGEPDPYAGPYDGSVVDSPDDDAGDDALATDAPDDTVGDETAADTGIDSTTDDAADAEADDTGTETDTGPDTSVPDTSVPDTGLADTGIADTGADTGIADTGLADTGIADTGLADTDTDTGAETDTGVDTGADTCTSVCTLGATQCSGAQVQSCTTTSSGCTDWSAPTSCPSNQTCTGSACAVCKSDDACGASCTACSGSTPRCLDGGSTSTCVQCLTNADCAPGQTCTGNACVTPPACSGTIVDWNWNIGTGPTGSALTTYGTSWSVGAATKGPSDGLQWLATVPGGNYPNNANDWVRLPTIDLSSWASCKVKITVDLWRDTEKYGSVHYDGGNLQYTTDPAGTSGWTLMDGGSMAYDGTVLGSCTGPSCVIYGQKAWTSSSNPKSKTGTFTSSGPLGSALTLRFTFFSDGDTSPALPGIYVRRVLVEAVP